MPINMYTYTVLLGNQNNKSKKKERKKTTQNIKIKLCDRKIPHDLLWFNSYRHITHSKRFKCNVIGHKEWTKNVYRRLFYK